MDCFLSVKMWENVGKCGNLNTQMWEFVGNMKKHNNLPWKVLNYN